MTIQIRSTPSSSAIPPKLRCPPGPEITSAPFIPPSSFAFLAPATRWASSPTPPPATCSTTGSPPLIRHPTPRLRMLCPMSLSPLRPPHRWNSGGRPAASSCSLPKRFCPASSSFGSVTRPRWRPRSSAPSRSVRTPTPPPSQASASAPFPHPARTPPPGPLHSRNDEPVIAPDAKWNRRLSACVQPIQAPGTRAR